MTKLEKIEREIAELEPGDLQKLLAWLAKHREEVWDRQIEEDIKAGRLDALAEDVLADHHAGRTRPL